MRCRAESIRHGAAARAVRAGLEAGALGCSTGRTAGHRDVRGNPVPGTYVNELAALLAVMDEVGAGCSGNSNHLDAGAVFFTAAQIGAFVKGAKDGEFDDFGSS